MQAWPPAWRSAVQLVLGSGQAMQLALGPRRVMIYNDAYAPMLGSRHPQALGAPFREAWPEIWQEIEPLVERVFAGETLRFDDLPLLMTRRGYPEDTWWTFSYSPVREESGGISGLLNVTVETTLAHQAGQVERERDAAMDRLLENEARFRALVTAGVNTIYRMSPDWGEMYQLDSHTLANTTAPIEDWVSKYIPDDDLPAVREAIARAIRTKSQFEFEHRVRLADGKIGWVLSRAVPLLSPDGEIVEWFGAASDVGARRLAIEALQLSEERQKFLLRLSDAMRPVADADEVKKLASNLLGEYLGVNRAFYASAQAGNDFWLVAEGFERDVTALPRQPFAMSAYGNWIVEGFRAGRSLVVDDMVLDPRFEVSERDAHLTLQIRAQIAAPLFKDDRLVAMLVVQSAGPRHWSEREVALLEDAAERVWSSVERARSEAALLQADRRKDEFLAVLAHELRNGLAPVVYNAEIGNRSTGDAALLKQLAARSGRQLQHVMRLVDDLLDVSRINTGKIELSLELVKVREVVNHSIEACRAEADRKHHRLTVIDETDFELAVFADRVRLAQVFSNLLSNATKYMDKGGTITVRIASDGEQAVVEIRDTGIGIPASALPRVFDLFTQVRNQQAYSAGGLGIGLSLVKQLVEMHGGRVLAASDGPGQGSTFTVLLPLGDPSSERALGSVAVAEAEPAVRPLRVLVVDDQRDSTDALSHWLGLQGHEAEPAYSGEEALARARARPPEVVLLDLGMPGMDGFEVARRLREELAGGAAMRIVALTGWGQEADRRKTRAASFDAHLAKPASSAELQEVLSTAARLLP